jgi:hypothetical protein
MMPDMMPAMTKMSHRVLCLHLLLAALAFLIYCALPTARANVKKAQVACMSAPIKLIQSALVHLHHNEWATNDKWLILEATHNLDYLDSILMMEVT